MKKLFSTLIKGFASSLLAITLVAYAPVTASAQTDEYTGPVLGFDSVPGDGLFDDLGEASPFDITLGFDFASTYMWRGQKLANGDPIIQPWAEISPDFEPMGDLYFGYWQAIAPGTTGKDSQEIDLWAGYSFDIAEIMGEETPAWADVNLDFGYIYYEFPATTTKTQELYAGLTYNSVPLSPSLYIYHDFDSSGGRGEWIELGVSHDLVFDAFTIATYGTLAWNHKQWTTSDTSKLSIFDFGASLPIPVGEHMSIEPFISMTVELGDTKANGGGDLTETQVYGGVSYSLSF